MTSPVSHEVGNDAASSMSSSIVSSSVWVLLPNRPTDHILIAADAEPVVSDNADSAEQVSIL